MIIVHTVAELRAAIEGTGRVGFVPTMGALHEGHLSLVREAVAQCDRVIVSVFVNPTQFAPGEDFAAYPRDEARDIALAFAAGAEVVFAPDAEELYGFAGTRVVPGRVAEPLEGVSRPGHFEGVATVVAKLFGIVGPCRAYFGLKDLQQCAVVRSITEDLFLPVELTFIETVREASGLALSSRNAYLEPAARAVAPQLYQELCTCAGAIESDWEHRDSALMAAVVTLRGHGFHVEYVELVDPATMRAPDTRSQALRIAAAVRLQGVRLIDNVVCRT